MPIHILCAVHEISVSFVSDNFKFRALLLGLTAWLLHFNAFCVVKGSSRSGSKVARILLASALGGGFTVFYFCSKGYPLNFF